MRIQHSTIAGEIQIHRDMTMMRGHMGLEWGGMHASRLVVVRQGIVTVIKVAIQAKGEVGIDVGPIRHNAAKPRCMDTLR